MIFFFGRHGHPAIFRKVAVADLDTVQIDGLESLLLMWACRKLGLTATLRVTCWRLGLVLEAWVGIG